MACVGLKKKKKTVKQKQRCDMRSLRWKSFDSNEKPYPVVTTAAAARVRWSARYDASCSQWTAGDVVRRYVRISFGRPRADNNDNYAKIRRHKQFERSAWSTIRLDLARASLRSSVTVHTYQFTLPTRSQCLLERIGTLRIGKPRSVAKRTVQAYFFIFFLI